MSDAARPAIVFSHANGFPAGTYAQLFARWRAAGFDVHAVEKVGHDPARPVTSNWPHLRDELLAFAERALGAAGSPACLVGHSLGGYLSLLAASRRPALACGVVLLDSPIVSGWKVRALRLAKATGVGGRFLPSHVSKRRREHWPSAEAAHAHFAAKPSFARFAPGVLADYVAAGMQPHGDGVRLAFDRAVETAIYNGLPHHLESLLRDRALGCPIAFVGGTGSNEIRRVGLQATRTATAGRVSFVEGSHLFPFERPADTAAAVLDWISAFDAGRGRAREAA